MPCESIPTFRVRSLAKARGASLGSVEDRRGALDRSSLDSSRWNRSSVRIAPMHEQPHLSARQQTDHARSPRSVTGRSWRSTLVVWGSGSSDPAELAQGTCHVCTPFHLSSRRPRGEARSGPLDPLAFGARPSLRSLPRPRSPRAGWGLRRRVSRLGRAKPRRTPRQGGRHRVGSAPSRRRRVWLCVWLCVGSRSPRATRPRVGAARVSGQGRTPRVHDCSRSPRRHRGGVWAPDTSCHCLSHHGTCPRQPRRSRPLGGFHP